MQQLVRTVYDAFCLGEGKCVGGPYDGQKMISRTGADLFLPPPPKPLPSSFENSKETTAETEPIHHYKWRQYYNRLGPSHGDWIYQPKQKESQ